MSTALIEYTFELAEWIALEYSGGDSLAELHRCHPDRVPPPLVVKRWRSKFPQFDELMREADAARAELLAEQALRVADGPKKAANARNAIQARQWLAERLDRQRYGQQKTVHNTHSGAVDLSLRFELDDEQLMNIAREGCIEGESQRTEAQAGRPALADTRGTPTDPPAPPARACEPLQISQKSGSVDPISNFPKKFQQVTDPFGDS